MHETKDTDRLFENETPLGIEMTDSGYNVPRIIRCLNRSTDADSEKATIDLIALVRELIQLKRPLCKACKHSEPCTLHADDKPGDLHCKKKDISRTDDNIEPPHYKGEGCYEAKE